MKMINVEVKEKVETVRYEIANKALTEARNKLRDELKEAFKFWLKKKVPVEGLEMIDEGEESDDEEVAAFEQIKFKLKS